MTLSYPPGPRNLPGPPIHFCIPQRKSSPPPAVIQAPTLSAIATEISSPLTGCVGSPMSICDLTPAGDKGDIYIPTQAPSTPLQQVPVSPVFSPMDFCQSTTLPAVSESPSGSFYSPPGTWLEELRAINRYNGPSYLERMAIQSGPSVQETLKVCQPLLVPVARVNPPLPSTLCQSSVSVAANLLSQEKVASPLHSPPGAWLEELRTLGRYNGPTHVQRMANTLGISVDEAVNKYGHWVIDLKI